MGPDGDCSGSHSVPFALEFAVVQEGAVDAAGDVFSEVEEQSLAELELGGIVVHDLPYAVKELDEHWTTLVYVGVLISEVAVSRRKHVTETDPVLLHQDGEPFDRPVVRV